MVVYLQVSAINPYIDSEKNIAHLSGMYEGVSDMPCFI